MIRIYHLTNKIIETVCTLKKEYVLSIVADQFFLKLGDAFIRCRFVITSFFEAVKIMDVVPAFLSDDISFVRALLAIILFCAYRITISVDTFIKIHNHTDMIIDLIKIFLYKRQ